MTIKATTTSMPNNLKRFRYEPSAGETIWPIVLMASFLAGTIFLTHAVSSEEERRRAMPEQEYCLKYERETSLRFVSAKCLKYYGGSNLQK